MSATFKVTIVTRTKNRALLLNRTLLDLKQQSYKNFEWFIVNDGGKRDEVDYIVDKARKEGVSVSIIHNEVSVGMEAASNMAIKNSDSEYLVIHDDDDTWDSNFLEATITFLQSGHGEKYAGVITHALLVNEEIINNQVAIKSVRNYNTELSAIHISKMAIGNLFPPISFLFKREVIAKVGYFDESLPVRGDWDFNLRFLLHYDIGVLPQPLAYWHHRQSAIGFNTNSVFGEGSSLHKEYDALIRNKYLREDIHNGKMGLGFLLNMQVRGTTINTNVRQAAWKRFIKRIIHRK